MSDYISRLRSKVGHEPIILNFAGCIIPRGNGDVLLQKRGDREKPIWGFPGGGLELGETLHDTAVREVREETGLEVAVTELAGVYSGMVDHYPNGDTAYSVTAFFVARRLDGDLRCDGSESIGLEYFAESCLPDLVNRQHTIAACNFFAGRRGVWS
ncbi:NUDIX hydrolase [Brachybacterium sp. FME24]|uniref:NUDIX hydrolase n=1 Tax=Brachybacterium sp. FME24 TaxID=2742605 RepID=UPI0018679E78|nr:NUDIX domain-containing protein [Brachybacterium sp. FME24]